MSRTIRRKNYERSLLRNTEGSKLAGIHTEYDIKLIIETWSFVKTFREPTKQEIWKHNKKWHGESKTSNDRTPSREFRRRRERILRIYTKMEIRKMINNPDYDGLFYSTPVSHYYDWD